MTHENDSREPVEAREEAAAPDEAVAAADPQETTPRSPEAPPVPPQRRPPPAPAAASRLQPSWLLSANGEQLSRDEIVARYRRQRGLPENPFENGARPTPPPGYRDRVMTEPRPAAFREWQAPPVEAPPPPSPRSFTVGQTIAIAAATALVAGGSAGVMSAHFAPPFAAAPVLAPAPAPEVAISAPLQLQVAAGDVAPAGGDTVIAKKPISTATLQVEDVTGETNSFIPLALHAVPAGLDKDMLLKISGVPEGAYLTSGHRQDDQVWALSLAELKNLKLVVPKASDPEIDLSVAAFETKTGELAAPVKTMTVALKDVVVEPTSAPPPDMSAPAAAKSTLPGADGAAMPVPMPSTQGINVALATPETAETQRLIGSADELFRAGKVKAALKTYERAWGNDGSAAAAFGIAQSYDPLVLATLAASDGTADKAQAIQWYQRAASGGNPDAAAAIVRLQMKP